MNGLSNRRILLIDDMPAIHEDFRKILAGPASAEGLDEMEAALFGTSAPARAAPFELDSAFQGEEGLARLRQALAADRPYALAFVDMRMPPGWDGVETVDRLWREDPRLQVVICTAYSDYSWDALLERLDVGDRLLILKKPFDPVEVRQLAGALTVKWTLAREAAARVDALEAAVEARTAELRQANEALQRDIAERKRLQSQLVQSEKLASVGVLAAGVAHEINNPVGFVLSNFSTLEHYLEELMGLLTAYAEAEPAVAPPEIAAHLRTLRENVELDVLREDLPALVKESRDGLLRVKRIVEDLRNFSRVDANPGWQTADLHRGIDATLEVVLGAVAPGPAIVREYGALPAIECLPSQINHVVMNLLMNAVQAIDSPPGRIAVRTGCEGDRVWCEVSDDGCGIPPENLERIFDPFFTTKPVGSGTGLGLSIAYGIVQKHRGRIEVRSEPGRGSTFRVWLPVTQPEQAGPCGAG